MRFAENEFGWDVHKTPPFLAFRAVRQIAIENHGEASILDLSQGEPGYGFAPSTRARRFYSFLLLVDSFFNNNQNNEHFGEKTEENFPDVQKKMEEIARNSYKPEVAEELIADLEFFLQTLEKVAEKQNAKKSRFDILFEIFKFSIPAGGRYPNPWGEEILRMAVAEDRSKEFGWPVSWEEVLLLSGCSQGVGTFFKSFGKEGVGFLQEGDAVLMISPVYAPYTSFIENRKLDLVSISIDPENGKLDEESFVNAKNFSKRIKAIILIHPNNPSGFPISEENLTKIAEIAEKNNAVILSDEVYAQFFDNFKSIVQIEAAKKRSLRLNALSKIERGTGLRLGDFYISSQANDFISKEILEKDCPGFLEKYKNVKWFLYLAKSPGGGTIGVFQHIAGVPGTAQILGLCHLVLGGDERKKYVSDLREKVKIFYENIGVDYLGNSYYGIIDLQKISGPQTKQKPIEQILNELAKNFGIVLMPANRFFSQQDREKIDRTKFIRVSLPNLSLNNTAKAGKLVREFVSQ